MEDRTTYHYYMGMQRVASGRFSENVGSMSGPGLKTDGASGTQSTTSGAVAMNQFVGILEEFGYQENQDFTRAELEVLTSMQTMYPEYSNTKADIDDNSMESPLGPDGSGESLSYCPDIETEVYWYHPNYLGSVDLVSNIDGVIHQFFQYTAWGENLNEYNTQSQGFDSPYRFNGKELDKETGLAYYGARYYQNRMSVWLSVDALAANGPHIAPSSFSHNNPIMLMAPDGNWPDWADSFFERVGNVFSGNGWNTNEEVLANQSDVEISVGEIIEGGQSPDVGSNQTGVSSAPSYPSEASSGDRSATQDDGPPLIGNEISVEFSKEISLFNPPLTGDKLSTTFFTSVSSVNEGSLLTLTSTLSPDGEFTSIGFTTSEFSLGMTPSLPVKYGFELDLENIGYSHSLSLSGTANLSGGWTIMNGGSLGGSTTFGNTTIGQAYSYRPGLLTVAAVLSPAAAGAYLGRSALINLSRAVLAF